MKSSITGRAFSMSCTVKVGMIVHMFVMFVNEAIWNVDKKYSYYSGGIAWTLKHSVMSLKVLF